MIEHVVLRQQQIVVVKIPHQRGAVQHRVQVANVLTPKVAPRCHTHQREVLCKVLLHRRCQEDNVFLRRVDVVLEWPLLVPYHDQAPALQVRLLLHGLGRLEDGRHHAPFVALERVKGKRNEPSSRSFYRFRAELQLLTVKRVHLLALEKLPARGCPSARASHRQSRGGRRQAVGRTHTRHVRRRFPPQDLKPELGIDGREHNRDHDVRPRRQRRHVVGFAVVRRWLVVLL